MKTLGLRTKLTLFYTGLFAFVLIGFSALFYQTLTQRLKRNMDEGLNQIAAGLHGYLEFEKGKPALVFDPNDPEEAYFIRTATRYYQLYDAASGQLITISRELELMGLRLSPEQVKKAQTGPAFTAVDSGRGRLRFHNYVFRDAQHHLYLMQVGASWEPVQEAQKEFLETLLLLVPATVLLAGIGGWWMAQKALKPVKALTATAREINISQLDRRLSLCGSGDELDQLADTFNQVFERLERAVQQMKQFTASISHELRTPLTALRGEAEVTLLRARSVEDYRRVLASQLEEFEKLTQMINELLTLAGAEAGEIQLSVQKFDITAMVYLLAEQMEPIAAWKKVSLRAVGVGPVEVMGDAQWLERVILNLLDNAIKFTPEGGRIDVAVRPEVGQARLEFRDSGIGIPPDALPHIFERFFRADPSRSKQVDGAGLGLSLVQWIVEAHHGRITVESAPGQGSCFTVFLPLAGASSSPQS